MAQPCGVQSCLHTVIEHDGHRGCLVDGHLYCALGDQGSLIPHVLNAILPDRVCSLLELDGHVHGKNCGHELVQHDDHWDFLVDGDLHHVAENCCARQCHPSLPSGYAFSHGKVSVLRQRKHPAKEEDEATQGLLPAASHDIEVVTEALEGTAHLTTKVYAGGICCPSEVPIIHDMLDRFPGVLEVTVGVMTKTVTIKHTTAVNDKTLVARLNEAHLEASLDAPRQHSGLKSVWIPKWNVLLSAALLLISLFSYLAGPTHQPRLKNLKWIAAGSIAIGIPPILLKAISAVRRLRMDINFLMTVAVAGALALHDVIEGAAVVVLFGVADWMETQCTASARDAISAVLALKPETAVLADTGEDVAADLVEVGTLLLAKPGEKIAIDGRVVRGSADIDQSLLTGESASVKKSAGDEVLGGTVNCGTGILEYETSALSGESAVARMAKLVEEATSKQSPMESLVARFAAWYTPVVVFACAGVAFIPMAAGVHNRKHWVYLALQILVTACPCALVLSTPVTVVASLAATARQGVLIKGGQYLEALGKTRFVSFDKTGTLTKGLFQVVWKQAFEGDSEARLLSLAGSLERLSNHPIAACIIAHAAAADATVDLEVVSAENVPGQGLTGLVDGVPAAIGNKQLLIRERVDFDDAMVENLIQSWGAKGSSLCFVACEGKLLGALAVADVPRADSKDALSKLQGMGIKIKMLTGDAPGPAYSVAAAIQLPSEDVHAALLPEHKLCLVDEMRKEGVVVHVGDGINDAPALAAADVGIAMGTSGAAIAVEAGDVTLFTNDLSCLSSVIRLGWTARRIILFNIAISVVTKIAVVVLAALGRFTLWGAVLVDAGAAIAVILNGMRCLRWNIRTGSIWGLHSNVHQDSRKHCHRALHSSSSADKACGKVHQDSHKHSHREAQSSSCASKACSKGNCCDSHGPHLILSASKACSKGSRCDSRSLLEMQEHCHTDSHTHSGVGGYSPSCGREAAGSRPHGRSSGCASKACSHTNRSAGGCSGSHSKKQSCSSMHSQEHGCSDSLSKEQGCLAGNAGGCSASRSSPEDWSEVHSGKEEEGCQPGGIEECLLPAEGSKAGCSKAHGSEPDSSAVYGHAISESGMRQQAHCSPEERECCGSQKKPEQQTHCSSEGRQCCGSRKKPEHSPQKELGSGGKAGCSSAHCHKC